MINERKAGSHSSPYRCYTQLRRRHFFIPAGCLAVIGILNILLHQLNREYWPAAAFLSLSFALILYYLGSNLPTWIMRREAKRPRGFDIVPKHPDA